MNFALHALGLFGIAFAAHWILWRTFPPRRHTAALLIIFFGALAGWLLANNSGLLPSTVPGWMRLQVAVFHTALSLAYIVAYSALEHRSPSMTLLVAVANSGQSGSSRPELHRLLSAASPVELRLEAMVRERLIIASEDGYILTAKGRGWAVFFSRWRRLLGLPRGG